MPPSTSLLHTILSNLNSRIVDFSSLIPLLKIHTRLTLFHLRNASHDTAKRYIGWCASNSTHILKSDSLYMWILNILTVSPSITVHMHTRILRLIFNSLQSSNLVVVLTANVVESCFQVLEMSTVSLICPKKLIPSSREKCCGSPSLSTQYKSVASFPGLPRFYLPFVIHGSGRLAFRFRVLLWTQTGDQNGGGLKPRLTNLCIIFHIHFTKLYTIGFWSNLSTQIQYFFMEIPCEPLLQFVNHPGWTVVKCQGSLWHFL